MKNILHVRDIPSKLVDKIISKIEDNTIEHIAIDVEGMGLNLAGRDRMCLIQILIHKEVHMVHFPGSEDGKPIKQELIFESPNLIRLLSTNVKKIFHFAYYDVSMIHRYLGILVNNVICTRTLSKIVRTYTQKHSLKELAKQYASTELNKYEQTSDWGVEKLTPAQLKYAAQDVEFLPKIYQELFSIAIRDNRLEVVEKIFEAIRIKVFVDYNGFSLYELLEH